MADEAGNPLGSGVILAAVGRFLEEGSVAPARTRPADSPAAVRRGAIGARRRLGTRDRRRAQACSRRPPEGLRRDRPARPAPRSSSPCRAARHSEACSPARGVGASPGTNAAGVIAIDVPVWQGRRPQGRPSEGTTGGLRGASRTSRATHPRARIASEAPPTPLRARRGVEDPMEHRERCRPSMPVVPSLIFRLDSRRSGAATARRRRWRF
jgi:hypothetical protein